MNSTRASRRGPARWLGGLLALAVLATPALSTWSIVVVDTRTREVCVGTATCLASFDIQKAVPLILPERGAAAAQAIGDPAGILRARIRRGFYADATPQQILAHLATINGHQARQFGIASFSGPPVTFSGSNTTAASGGVAAIAGDLRYAIQGNILVGQEVWLEAEQALLNTPGDLSQRVMAAMEAARALGGDGRCSCTSGPATSCGVPPPGFTKSAHCAYIGLARVGDVAGKCNAAVGCASGEYFLSLNFAGAIADPDPVVVLQGMYATWRAGLAGRPDQLLSQVEAQADALVADGRSWTQVDVRLVDIEGLPLSSGGMVLALERLSPAPAVTLAGAVVDNGDGTYSFPLTATTTAGTDVWRVRVTDAFGTVLLQPDVTLRVDALVPLHAGLDRLSTSAGGAVPFTLNAGGAGAGARYVLLASASGTQPGTPLLGQLVPLNYDRLFNLTLFAAHPPLCSGFRGLLDADGRAVASFAPSPGLLAPFAGLRLDWAAVVLGNPPGVVGPIGLELTP